MSQAHVLPVQAASAEAPDRAQIGPPWAKFFMLVALMAVVFSVYRVYQHTTSFTYGLDYFSADFQKYWMNLLYAQLISVGVFGAAFLSYLWTSRDRNLDRLSPRAEMSRIFVLATYLLVLAIIFYVTGSIYTEADAAWHQVTIRDTDFTPTHIVLFYFCLPVLIVTALAAFLYARTRIPMFANRVSVPFVIIVSGAAMILPNLGFNEWGHTFFYAEELFAAPIHWGFVLLGWSTFALGGLFVQILGRAAQLTRLKGDLPLEKQAAAK